MVLVQVYPCGTYGPAASARPFNDAEKTFQLDYREFNAPFIAQMEAANEKANAAGVEAPFSAGRFLQTLTMGTRVTSMTPDERSPIQTNCARLEEADYNAANPSHFKSSTIYGSEQHFTWLPLAFDVPSYSGNWVQTFVIFHNYQLGDYKKKKADTILAYGPSFGGDFPWERSVDENARHKNADWLIGLYNQHCKETGSCKGYYRCEDGECASTMK